MRPRIGAALALTAALLAGCDQGPDPSPRTPSQAEARAEVPVDGVDGTQITWRLDDEDADAGAIRTVQYLLAIDAVGSTYDPVIDSTLIGAFVEPPNLGFAHDLRDKIDPNGADAERWGPTVGDQRIWLHELYRGDGGEADAYPNLDGPYVIVGACSDNRARTLREHPDVTIDSGKQWYVVQQEDDTDGSTVWKIKGDNALAGDDDAFDAFSAECDTWKSS